MLVSSRFFPSPGGLASCFALILLHAPAVCRTNRPLYYYWPEAEEAYTHTNCYLFGDSLLCSPIASAVEPASGISATEVWFPPGVWRCWFTGKRCVRWASCHRCAVVCGCLWHVLCMCCVCFVYNVLLWVYVSCVYVLLRVYACCALYGCMVGGAVRDAS